MLCFCCRVGTCSRKRNENPVAGCRGQAPPSEGKCGASSRHRQDSPGRGGCLQLSDCSGAQEAERVWQECRKPSQYKGAVLGLLLLSFGERCSVHPTLGKASGWALLRLGLGPMRGTPVSSHRSLSLRIRLNFPSLSMSISKLFMRALVLGTMSSISLKKMI